MRSQRQLAVAVALVAGLGAAILAWIALQQAPGGKQKMPETIAVPVPVQGIPVGTELRTEMFQLQQIAKAQAPPNVITDVQALQGRVAVMDLPAGQPVRADQIQRPSAQLGISYVLNPGVRAMAVSLDVVGLWAILSSRWTMWISWPYSSVTGMWWSARWCKMWWY